MATGGKDGPRAYEGDDEVDDYLLNQISKFVLYDKLGRLARDLGLNQAEYSRIAAVPNKPPEERIFEVLSKWRQKRSSRKAKDVVSHVVEWQKDGYIDPVIWEHLTTKINLSMLPQPPQLPPYPLEEPHTEKDAFTDLKERLKDSLDREWRNCMSHDWISPEKAKSFPLRKFYVGLRWTKMVKGALKNYKQKLTSIYDILIAADTHMSKKTKAVGILATAEPGMGKTCSLALLALDWVDESQELLQLFDFVFLLQLRYTNKISTLPELIIMQHGKLKYSDLSLLQSILEGTTKHRVLIMMDGYDEYKRGTNKAVDRAIEFTMGNCFLILTSRPGFVSKQVRDKMDGEVIIEGFSPENIIECSSMYLGSRDLSNMMMAQAEECGIFDLLCIPIILLMVCVVFSEKESLPKTTTSLMTTIFEMIMDRSTLKKFGLKSSQLKELEALLYTLGEFSWKALQSDFQQLLLIKEQLLKQSPPILDLGLLFETGIDVSSVRELSSFVSFHHKLLQEYSGSYFLERYLRNVNNIKETLLDLFPSMVHIRKYREVVIFLCGLMSDPTPIVQHVYEMCVQEKQQKMVEGENPSIRWEERHLFQSLYNESGIPLPGRPLHNAYINYYSHEFYEGELDTSPVHTPSQLFIFKYISKGMVCNYHGTGNGEELPNSAINVYRPRHIDTSKMMALLRTISQHQPISHLCLKKFHHEDFAEEDVLTLSNDAKTISLDACTLPQGVLLHLFQQLPNCAVLENLDIHKTDLEFMKSLDLSNLKSLTGLKLMATHLSPEVCQSVLGQIGDLDRLIHLNLKMNCLAGSLSNFLPESHHSLPSLELFSLANNDLKKSDLTQITKLIEQLKIPNLHTLQLPSCELKVMENTLSELLEACITHHNKELTVTLWRNKLSKQFKETLKSRCEGTLITLQLVMPLGNYFMYSK